MTNTLLELQPHDAPLNPDSQPVELVRVFHLINGEHYAGAEKVQDVLAQNLPDHGFEVGFGCVKPDQFSVQRKSHGPLVDFPMRSRFDLRQAKQIARFMQQENYQLLHTHTPRTALVGHLAAKIAGVPMVHHVHGQTASEMKRIAGWLNAVTERVTLRRADRLIAVSGSLRDYLQGQGFDDERITVVFNGVSSLETVRDRVPPRGQWTLGMIALFRPRKGLESLLQAVAQLREDGFDVSLRAIGRFETDEYETEVRAYVEQLGIEQHVEWTGFTSNVYGELAKIDLAILPSLLAEGLPMVLIEAMAVGVPIVGSRVDGIIDVIEHGENGLLTQPGDADSLAEQLARVISGEVDWQQLRSECLIRQREMFSDKSMAAGVAKVYREVLNQANKRDE
jgi:glycosyltransferase involved in cell wall biosynthesis